MGLFIQNGSDVDAGLGNTIAVSTDDGATFDFIRPNQVQQVLHVYIEQPEINYPFDRRAVVRVVLEDGELEFDVQNVPNQPTWNTGAATARDGLFTAVQDINTWINV